jgi:hypothetical protein
MVAQLLRRRDQNKQMQSHSAPKLAQSEHLDDPELNQTKWMKRFARG